MLSRVLKEKYEKEKYMYTSNTDGLTKCFNRRAYDTDMEKLDLNTEWAYISLDLNGLKQANDSLGHSAGDELICAASNCMKFAFASYGKIYRIGGDEFCVIMPDAKENSIEGAMDRLKELQKQYKGTDHSVEVEIACGYAFYDDNVDQSFVDTRKRADTHMYENKRMLKGKEPR